VRTNDQVLLAAYERVFTASELQLIEITPAVIERATQVRARYRLSTPDAIQMATAIEQHADIVVTGDRDLTRCPDIVVDRVTQPG
jgi:predicted nucleic acid-binding protein